MSYSFRHATSSDLSKIMQITTDAKAFLKGSGSTQWNEPNGYPDRCDFEEDIKNDYLYVLLDNNKVIGYEAIIYGQDESYTNIDGAWINNTSDYYTIHRLAIDKDYRSKHISKYLIEEAIKLAKEKGITSIKGDTHRLNIPMQKLFLSNGFKYCGEIILVHNKYDNKRLGYELIIKESCND